MTVDAYKSAREGRGSFGSKIRSLLGFKFTLHSVPISQNQKLFFSSQNVLTIFFNLPLPASFSLFSAFPQTVDSKIIVH